jgi:hypothetical protein
MPFRKPFAVFIGCTLIFLLTYPLAAFAEWEWQISHWHWFTRLILAIIMMVVLVITALGVYSDDN